MMVVDLIDILAWPAAILILGIWFARTHRSIAQELREEREEDRTRRRHE